MEPGSRGKSPDFMNHLIMLTKGGVCVCARACTSNTRTCVDFFWDEVKASRFHYFSCQDHRGPFKLLHHKQSSGRGLPFGWDSARVPV